MNPTKRLASGIMTALLFTQASLAVLAITATIVKEWPETARPGYLMAMVADDVAWR